MEYKTSKGTTFSFSGWDKGKDPLSMFDRGKYLACLHGLMVYYNLLADPELLQLSVEDDGLMHEVLHLASGVEISTHNTMEGLRKEISVITRVVDDCFDRYS